MVTEVMLAQRADLPFAKLRITLTRAPAHTRARNIHKRPASSAVAKVAVSRLV